ncbi:MAG: ATPase P [Desulfovermiculus sp.]|nr:ATPase P [Desulfovermiculus sp.]
MLQIDIPDFGHLQLEHLVMDYNGTLAVGGEPVHGVRERVAELSKHVQVHVITADTFGRVQARLEGWACSVKILGQEDQVGQKLTFVQELGTDKCVCIGNGRNDRMMLENAALGLAVMLEEGTSRESLLSADIALPGIVPALDLLLHPLRLTATLRS